jgi:DNA-binding CsgD family transcriptional regulator
VAELAKRTRVATVGLFAAEREAILAIIDGRLDETLVLLQRFAALADELGVPIRGRNFSLNQLITPALYLGRADTWLKASEEHPTPPGPARPERRSASYFMRTAARAMCLAQLGRLEEAREVTGPVLTDLEHSFDDESRIGDLVWLLQVAVAVEDRAAAQALSTRLASVAHLCADLHMHTCVARHLGAAAEMAGDRMAARRHYLQALEAAGRIRFRPELALTHLQLAELLLEGGDNHAQSEALEHLDVAIPELQDMHMQPGLERGLALRKKLTPAAAQGPARPSDRLTAREREIAMLVADGLSNRDIAEKLVISEGTVEVHVKHLLGKLGFSSRAQVAGWVARQGPG